MKIKKQNFIALLLCISMVIGLSIPMWAAEAVEFTYKVNTDKKSVTITGTKQGAEKISGDIKIPKTIDKYTVTEIGDSAFESYEKITSVSLPTTIVKIGDRAFNTCTKLNSITIPKDVTEIGEDVFFDCKALKSITIPAALTSIGANAFGWCTSLKEIKVEKSNKNYVSVDGVLFEKDMKTIVAYPNAKGTEYTIPNGVTTIARFAFCGCTKLKNVTIPKSVTFIGGAAFNNCKALVSITIPESVTVIREGTFDGCSSLKSITIPNNVVEFGEHVFIGCSSLSSVTLPEKLTTITNQMFRDCKSLKSITLPNTVLSIGDDAFNGCSALESITIPSTTTSISKSAFDGCKKLEISSTAKSAAQKYATENGIPFALSDQQKIKVLSTKPITDTKMFYDSGFKVQKTNFTSYKTSKADPHIVLALTVPATDMSVLSDKKSSVYIEFEVHINKLNLCGEYLDFEITSSGDCDAAEYQWRTKSTNLKEGWNTIKLSVFDNEIITTGKPNLKKINFIRFFMTDCEPGLQLQFDNLRIVTYSD